MLRVDNILTIAFKRSHFIYTIDYKNQENKGFKGHKTELITITAKSVSRKKGIINITVHFLKHNFN